MPNLRTDGKQRSAPVGWVKTARRASGSAQALALTRPAGQTTLPSAGISRSALTNMTVAEEAAKAASRRMRRVTPEAPACFETAAAPPLSSRSLPLRPLRSQWYHGLPSARPFETALRASSG
jgi:hypothetical protein